MKPTIKALIFSLSLSTLPALATDSAHHTSKASKHSVLAVTHGVASTATVASAVIATPVIVVGSAAVVSGTASMAAGSALADSANHSVESSNKNSGPLVITETTITADPAPNQTIKIQQKHTITHTQ
ncbi:MAG: hypothetical protein ABJJ44_09830 [Paraglaciecola sp.]|uniref:hypothetical protein n=1 Tax=Paraglaciecola sp. TaxID=1920173 RepID=UPI003296A24C